MSNTKPVKSVTVTCACGAQFSREVKRGRPQVWCPSCVEVPFYERINAAAPTTVTEAGEVVVVADRIVNVNDPLDAVRVDVEAAMAVINAENKARYDALVAAGTDSFEAGVIAGRETYNATTAMYALYRPQYAPYIPREKVAE